MTMMVMEANSVAAAATCADECTCQLQIRHYPTAVAEAGFA